MSADERPEPPRLSAEDVEQLRAAFVKFAQDLQPFVRAVHQQVAVFARALDAAVETIKRDVAEADRPDGDRS